MIRRALSRLFRREDGTATIEFVLVVPVVISIFMASVEAGFYMTKHVMMERGLDLVMRDVRLGNLGTFGDNKLRKLICAATPVIEDCENSLLVEMRPISTNSFSMPDKAAPCINRNETTKAEDRVEPGGSHEIMLIRICSIQDPIFPSTGIGLRLRAVKYGGGYQMVAASIFVNEPR